MTDTTQFQFDRDIAAKPDRLWHLLMDPDARSAWGAPSDDHVLVVDSHDVRVGGTDTHRCGPKDNPEFEVETRWYHIDAPNRACFTENLVVGGKALSVSLVTYTVAASDKGAHLNVDVSVSSHIGPEMLDEYQAGWTSGFNRLMKLIEAEAA